MVEFAYAPMHGKRKELTLDDMHRTLAKHVPRETNKVSWQKPAKSTDGTYYVRSVCERYVVCAARSMGKWRYTATDLKGPKLILGTKDSADEAKALCGQ